eukprot:COSAG02_NODE_352_length_24036_cov_20.479258_21_plen_100_part_00
MIQQSVHVLEFLCVSANTFWCCRHACMFTDPGITLWSPYSFEMRRRRAAISGWWLFGIAIGYIIARPASGVRRLVCWVTWGPDGWWAGSWSHGAAGWAQ